MLKETYKNLVGRICSNPGCKTPNLEIHVHHIYPVASGGRDEMENYITLCRKCHGQAHRKNNKIELYAWKHLVEIKRLPSKKRKRKTVKASRTLKLRTIGQKFGRNLPCRLCKKRRRNKGWDGKEYCSEKCHKISHKRRFS